MLRLIAIALGASAALMGASHRADAALLMKSDATYAASLAANDIDLVGVALVSNPAVLDAVSARIRIQGGAVTFTDPPTGFLSAVVHREMLKGLQQDSQIDALAIDRVSDEPTDHTEWVAPSSATPVHTSAKACAHHRVSASDVTRNLDWRRRVARDRADFLRDLGATQFVRDHPTWDGRGITIAHVENAPDFLAPELELGSTLDGQLTPKYRQITVVQDLEPRLDGRAVPVGRDAWQWVTLSPPLRAVDGTVEIAECPFKVPRSTVSGDDEYRVGTIAIPPSITSVLGLVSANCLGGGRFGVLWSDKQARAWIDSNGDLDFQDEHAIGDFADTGRFGILSAPGHPSVGFALHREENFLTFTFGMSSHATGVAAFAAGSPGRTGQVQGVAPGANFVLITHGDTTTTFARALILAFGGPADIVLLESQYPTLGSDTDGSEATVLDLLIARLIDLHKKPCFITGGNEPGLGSVLDPTPANAIVVGAWQSRRATRIHLGFDITEERTLHWATSEGPTGRGSLKPDLLAPVLHYAASTSLDQYSGHMGVEDLPMGYQVFFGTSGAAPVAAGAAALLMSAGKQSGLRIEPTEVGRALQSSARFIRGLGAVQQGSGTIDVDEAWAYLVTDAARLPVDIRVEAPVETATSHSLPNPNVGAGLFIREGISLGKPIERCIRVTRLSGEPERASFSLTLAGASEGAGGDRGTALRRRAARGSVEPAFTTPTRISLPLNEAVCVPVRITPFELGVHSSILELRYPDHPNSVARRIPVTVVVPYELDGGHQFRAMGRLRLSRPGRAEVFFRVLPGTEALNVKITGIGISPAASSKDAMLYAYLRSPQGEPVASQVLSGTATRRTVSIYRPAPGVWAMCAINYGGQVLPATSLPRQGSREAVSFVVAATRVVTKLTADGSRLNVENAGARVLGAIRSSDFGIQTTTQGSLDQGEQQVISTVVPVNVELLVLQLSAQGDPSAALEPPAAMQSRGHLDLLLFDCEDGHCQLNRQARGETNTKRLVVRRPKSGPWKMVVDGTYATQLNTAFSIETVFISASHHEAATDDRVNTRDTGAKWSVGLRPAVARLRSSVGAALPDNSRPVLPVYFDDLITGSLHDFKSPGVQFGDQKDHREPAPLGLQWIDVGDSSHLGK